jgi:hypothetical protein
MTEKEFLKSFIEHAEAMGYLSDQDIEKFIDSFLEYSHQTYFEVEFIKKEEEPLTFKGVPIVFDKPEEIADTESIEIKRVSPIEFTEEQAKQMLEMHLEMKKKYK